MNQVPENGQEFPYKLVVLDFDGTLCLGDDPVMIYAEAVDESLTENGIDSFSVREAVQRGLAAGNLNVPEIVLDDGGFPKDIVGRTEMVLWPLQDGYQLVQLLGLQAGLHVEKINTAFRVSRGKLLERGLASSDVHAPEGVASAIAELRDKAFVVLITNSPAHDFDVWLKQLGLEESFDLVINSAKKPLGMAAAVDRALGTFETSESRIPLNSVVSIGDIWGNDLEYIHETGGTTILIDRFATGLGIPDARVRTAAEAFQLLSQSQVTVQ